jgi:hypothetical protein
MAFDARKANELFDSALRIWTKVKPAHDHSSTVLEPFSKLYGAGFAGPIAHADDSLKKCVEVAAALRKFTAKFAAPGSNRWKDGGTILAEFTNASVGRKVENQQAVLKLRQLADFLDQLKSISAAGKDFTGAAKIYADGIARLQRDTVAMGGNIEASRKASSDFANVATSSDHILPNVTAALQMAERMAR